MPFPALLTVGPVIIGLVVVYLPMLRKLVYDWGHDDNYSHGFLIVPIAAYLVWERRAELIAARPSPSASAWWSCHQPHDARGRAAWRGVVSRRAYR